jgi:predicted flap endonuclease-1-like 5' DNA nuclease
VTVRENFEKVKDNLEKVAYTAVGAPVAGVRAMRDKTEAMTRTVKEKRDILQSDVEKEIKDWVAEGEALVDRMVDWVRSTGAPTEVRSARQSAAEPVRSAMTGIARRIDQAVDLIEPDIALTDIRGVGPATAATMRSAGVPGISGLLERTATEAKLQELSEETGIGVDSLTDWRAQVDFTVIDGVGDSYQRALHAIGIGTMTHLANADAGSIVDRLSKLDRPGLPSQDPSKATVSKWIQKARRLSLQDRK